MQKNMYANRWVKWSLSNLLQSFSITLLMGMLLTSASLMAQEKKTVTGTVLSENDSYGLPGVSVVVKGTSNGTTTNAKGEFSIDASSGNTLVFSFIGY